MVERYYNEKNEMGILISSGFGAGWGTWYEKQEIAYDKRIVEKWINEKPSGEEMKVFLESLGYKDVYMGGYDSLVLWFVPKGTTFCIQEYDGAEGVFTYEDLQLITA